MNVYGVYEKSAYSFYVDVLLNNPKPGHDYLELAERISIFNFRLLNNLPLGYWSARVNVLIAFVRLGKQIDFILK